MNNKMKWRFVSTVCYVHVYENKTKRSRNEQLFNFDLLLHFFTSTFAYPLTARVAGGTTSEI